MARSIRFENILDRSRYKFGGKLALFMRFGTFFMMKAKQERMLVALTTVSVAISSPARLLATVKPNNFDKNVTAAL